MRERAIPVSDNANFITGRDVRYYSPTGEDITELRRQQLRFGEVVGEESRRNAWMAIPALAPFAAVLGVEAATAVAARLLPPILTRQGPLALRPVRGNTLEAQAGRRAHDALRDRVNAKDGWKYEREYTGSNGRIQKPDVSARARDPMMEDRRYLMELKPNTPTGQKAGAAAARRYKDQTKNKTRVIYYDPKDYM